MKKNMLGWASNILNVLVFIILLVDTKKECVSVNSVFSSVIMIAISLLIQIISGIQGEEI